MNTTLIKEISVQELQALRQQKADFFLLDVREPDEYALCNLQGHLLPLGQLKARLQELQPHQQRMVIVHCRSGGRSAQAAAQLQTAGFTQVFNLKGGILAWAREIDPSVPTY